MNFLNTAENWIGNRMLAAKGWYNRINQDPNAQRMGQRLQMMVPGGTVENVALKGAANFGDDIAKYAMKLKSMNRERRAIQPAVSRMNIEAKDYINNQRGTNMLSKMQQYTKTKQQNAELLNDPAIRERYFNIMKF